MFVSLLELAAPEAGEASPFGYLGVVVAVGLAAAVSSRFFKRRNAATVAAAENAVPSGFVFQIAPAPPLPESIVQLRGLLGASSPAVALTRYSRLTVTCDASGLVIGGMKEGPLVTIRPDQLAAVDAKPATIRPKGTLVPRTWPSIWLHVREGDDRLTLAVTPISGVYDKVTQARAEELAGEISARLGSLDTSTRYTAPNM